MHAEKDTQAKTARTAIASATATQAKTVKAAVTAARSRTTVKAARSGTAARFVAVASAVLLTTGALAGCSSGSSGNEVPSAWIHQQYSDYPFDSDRSDPPAEVADEIDGHTSARARIRDSGMVLLRYRNDIVAVSPFENGSRIEIETYGTGYRRWNNTIRHRWPAPDTDGDSFRGGGPGSGK